MAMIAAAPSPLLHFSSLGDFRVDSSFTDSNWQKLDSIVTVTDTTQNLILTATGVAVMSSWQVLYIGFGNDSLVNSAQPNLDTITFHPLQREFYPSKVKQMRVPFTAVHILSRTAATDTFYLTVANGENASKGQLQLEDVFFSVQYGESP